MNKFFIIILSALLLTGCSVGEKRLKVFTLEEPRAKLNIDAPTPLTMEQIRWIIITSENAQEVFAKLEAEGIDPVLFGLTDKDYQVIARNFAQIRAKLVESNKILEKYKEYYEAPDNKESTPKE
jgi:hypothetical protein